MSDPVAHIPPLADRMIEGVVGDVVAEIHRQDRLARAGKFGGTHILPGGPDLARLGVLTEEVGEVAKEVNEAEMGNRDDDDHPELYKELIQTGASAVAWATALLERMEGKRDA